MSSWAMLGVENWVLNPEPLCLAPPHMYQVVLLSEAGQTLLTSSHLLLELCGES